MGAITVEEIVEGGIGTSGTSVTVTAPATVNSGDLLIFGMAVDGSTATMSENTSTDWNELAQSNGAAPGLGVWYLIADGSEDAEEWTFDISESETAVYQMFRLSGWHGSEVPDISSVATGTGATADPPSVTAGWGAEDENLFIPFAGLDALAFTAGPSGYDNFVELDSSTLGASGPVSIAAASDSLNQATENPGTFTNGSEDWRCYTVVVRPSAAAAESVHQSRHIDTSRKALMPRSRL